MSDGLQAAHLREHAGGAGAGPPDRLLPLLQALARIQRVAPAMLNHEAFGIACALEITDGSPEARLGTAGEKSSRTIRSPRLMVGKEWRTP